MLLLVITQLVPAVAAASACGPGVWHDHLLLGGATMEDLASHLAEEAACDPGGEPDQPSDAEQGRVIVVPPQQSGVRLFNEVALSALAPASDAALLGHAAGFAETLAVPRLLPRVAALSPPTPPPEPI
jgi:hypothetical protein